MILKLSNSIEKFVNDYIFEQNNSLTIEDWKNKIKELLYILNSNLHIENIEFVNQDELPYKATCYGMILNNDILIGNVYILPFKCRGSRTGFLAQQVFPAQSDIIKAIDCSSSYCLFDCPVYIIDCGVDHLTAYQELSVKNAKYLGFNYIEYFNSSLSSPLKSAGVDFEIDTLEKLDDAIKKIVKSTPKENKYFTLDKQNRIFKLLNLKLQSKNNAPFVSLTNEPYYYAIRILPALYLAWSENWIIDTSDFDTYTNGSNDNIDAIIIFINKLLRKKMKPMQKIFYGAPGTGKSYTIEKYLQDKNVDKDNIFRVTFYPEYSYGDFVGQLLPTQDPITKSFKYELKEGDFLKALIKAYSNTNEDVYLIIEEMSRGNATAIFGDIFQLLDRENKGPFSGYSRYAISNEIISSKIPQILGNKVKLPSNFHILGSLNTCDQSVYPLDTAFKRRFMWEYIDTRPVKDNNGDIINEFLMDIISGNTVNSIKWSKFYTTLNDFIANSNYLDLGEDKQIGQFFIEYDTDINDVIKGKLLFYLWNDIELVSIKSNVKLFINTISSFSCLINKYTNGEQIFSDDFIRLLDL